MMAKKLFVDKINYRDGRAFGITNMPEKIEKNLQYLDESYKTDMKVFLSNNDSVRGLYRLGKYILRYMETIEEGSLTILQIMELRDGDDEYVRTFAQQLGSLRPRFIEIYYEILALSHEEAEEYVLVDR